MNYMASIVYHYQILKIFSVKMITKLAWKKCPPVQYYTIDSIYQLAF